MKFVSLIVVAAIFIMSCSDNRNRDDLKNPCNESSLLLESYKTIQAQALSIPGKDNKDDQGNTLPTIPAKNGKYILNRATIHIHDKNLLAREVNGQKQFMQMSFGMTRVAQQEDDIAKNVLPFQSIINCLAGLKQEYAGATVHEVNFPTRIEFSDQGSEIVLTGMKTYEMGFYADGLMKVKAMEEQNKGPTDNVDDINKTDSEPISNFYRNTENGEVYQLQNRVTLGNVTITLINEYTRCVAPQENDKYGELNDEEKKALQDAFGKCNTQSIKVEDLN